MKNKETKEQSRGRFENLEGQQLIKFIKSEKAKKFDEISLMSKLRGIFFKFLRPSQKNSALHTRSFE
jgi:hypothetical protein